MRQLINKVAKFIAWTCGALTVLVLLAPFFVDTETPEEKEKRFDRIAKQKIVDDYNRKRNEAREKMRQIAADYQLEQAVKRIEAERNQHKP